MTIIAAPKGAYDAEPGRQRPLRILIVDDNFVPRGAIRSAFEKSDHNFEIVEAETGEEALVIIKHARFDLIFCDIQMPGISGPEALAVAFRDELSKPFMVLMSTKIGATVAEIGRKIGVYEFLAKPFKASDVLGAVDAYMQLRKPIRLLLVDDSSTARKLMSRILHQSRFQMVLSEAQSGEDAIQLAKTKTFDVIIVDFNMPGIDGVETAGNLLRSSPNAQIVVISTEQQSSMVRAAQFVGAFAFLKKPFGANDIDVVLHDAFAIKRPSLAVETHAIFSNADAKRQKADHAAGVSLGVGRQDVA
jgi:two-component system, chemotaxis family, chemotaxis protein CheY